MNKKPDSDVVSDPALSNPSAAAHDLEIQRAVEAFIEQHGSDHASDPATFA